MTPYLKKSALFPPQILPFPSKDLGLVVVIPAYRETALLACLQGLLACDLPPVAVEVIVVLNDGEKEEESVHRFHQSLFKEVKDWANENRTARLSFHVLYHGQLPRKHAGVGVARKIGMDEAVYRLEAAEQPKGLIVCYDADSACQRNYLQAIYHYFHQHSKCPAASIHYEHPISGAEFSPATYAAIIDYELHLRYYILIQRWAGFPLAFHTVGSSMAVRADAYQAQGGMNRRKAGEDFYFLHKFIPLGDFGEIKDTMVIPSPRISDRVPFGTGRSVGDILSQKTTYLTYAPASFADLQAFLQLVPSWYTPSSPEALQASLAPSIAHYLSTIDFAAKLQEIRDNTRGFAPFVQRFYRWFNAFQLMKYLHHARDHFYPNIPVAEAANWLIQERAWGKGELAAKECLLLLREKERMGEA